MSVITLELHEHTALLWLDRPERSNAMGPAFFEQLPQLMAQVEENDDVRCVVIAAKGKHFSAGLDLKSDIGLQLQRALSGGLAFERQKLLRTVHRLQAGFRALGTCSKPTIAAIHGSCIGGGLDLIAACDIRYASQDTTISLRETQVAMVADLGSLQRLEGIIGRGQLREMAFTGRDYDAAEVSAMGLVNQILPTAQQCLEHAMQTAEMIAANSPLAVQGAKQMLLNNSEHAISRGLDQVAVWNSAFLPSEDLMEAVGAFVQKRTPKFKGR